MMMLDKYYFPGFTRKAITFSIDDGNVLLDKKFINIVRPGGIRGTFNISDLSLDKFSAEYYKEQYEGFGIANHCSKHPFAMKPGVEYKISLDEFNPDTADVNMLYKSQWDDVYMIHMTNGWRKIVSKDKYLSLVVDAKESIEAVFGDGAVRQFVWPYYMQEDPRINDGIIEMGYRSIRQSGRVKASTGFALPEQRFGWKLNADHTDLLSLAEIYNDYPDDGRLKFFSFGVHSHDYENQSCWDVLESFVQKYGNRREDFYYAPVDEIFDYEDALNMLEVGENYVYNPTSIPIYIKLNGEFIILPSCSKAEIQ